MAARQGSEVQRSLRAGRRGRRWLVEPLERRAAASELLSFAAATAFPWEGEPVAGASGPVDDPLEAEWTQIDGGQESVFAPLPVDPVPESAAAGGHSVDTPLPQNPAPLDAAVQMGTGLELQIELNVLLVEEEQKAEELQRTLATLVPPEEPTPVDSVGGGVGQGGDVGEGGPATAGGKAGGESGGAEIARPGRGDPPGDVPLPEESRPTWIQVARLYARQNGIPVHSDDLNELAPAFDGLSVRIIQEGRTVGQGRLADQMYSLLSEGPVALDEAEAVAGELQEGTGVGMAMLADSGSGTSSATPTAVDDGPYLTPMDKIWEHGSVLANDFSNGNGELRASLYRPAQHGTVVLQSNGTFTYEPFDEVDPAYAGMDVFWYIAMSATGQSEPAAVTVHVIGADIDADSNNDYSLERSTIEEQLEEEAPGKVMIQGVPEVNGYWRTPIGLNLQGVDALSPWNLQGWTMRLVDRVGPTGEVGVFRDLTGATRPAWQYAADEVMSAYDLGGSLSVFGEAEKNGVDEVWLHLFTPDGKLFHTDRVRFSVIDRPDLKVFRPQTQGGAPTHYQWPHYDMFRKRVVPESLEQTPGVGIRRNWDSAVEYKTEENDLIELQAVRLNNVPGVEYRLRRSADRYLQVWDAPHVFWTGKDLFERTAEHAVPRKSLTALVTPPGGGGMTKLWVEWVDPEYRTLGAEPGSADLTLEVWAANTDTSIYQADVVKFHPFNSIVVIMAGEFQVPHDPPLSTEHGIVKLAIDLYKLGYDVYMYDEPDLVNGPRNLDIPLREVTNAINLRGVDEIALMGYSHGGGTVYRMADDLEDAASSGAITKPWTLKVTGYVDAINWFNMAAERRLPPGSKVHVNYYQKNDPVLTGESTWWGVGTQFIDHDMTKFGLNHTNIDNDARVQNGLKSVLDQNISK